MDENIAENLTARKKLLEIIRTKPGIHFRELYRESELAMGEVEYHLGVLEKMEIISKRKSGGYTKYYPIDELGSSDKRIIDVLRQGILRDILLFLISGDRVSHGDIVKEFNLLKSTTTFYMNKLIENELVTKQKKGRQVYYQVNDPENVLKLILVYKEGFGDELVKRVEGLWGNL